MSDILDYIRARLAVCQPEILPFVDPILIDAGYQYGGEKTYIRRPKARPLMEGDSRAVALEHHVSRRTAQRWLHKR